MHSSPENEIPIDDLENNYNSAIQLEGANESKTNRKLIDNGNELEFPSRQGKKVAKTETPKKEEITFVKKIQMRLCKKMPQRNQDAKSRIGKLRRLNVTRAMGKVLVARTAEEKREAEIDKIDLEDYNLWQFIVRRY